MMSIFDIFQQLDRIVRNRPDAQRWRVTISNDTIEIWRRPVLTSAVTLAALGIGDAPMPMPQRCYTVYAVAPDANEWCVCNHNDIPPSHVNVASIIAIKQHVTALLSAFPINA